MARYHFAIYPFIEAFFTRLSKRREHLGQQLAALESRVFQVRAGYLGLASDQEALALALDDSALAARAGAEAIGLRAREQAVDAAVQSREEDRDRRVREIEDFIAQTAPRLTRARAAAESADSLFRVPVGAVFNRATGLSRVLSSRGARNAGRQVAALCGDLDRQRRELAKALDDLSTAQSPAHSRQPSIARPSSVRQRLTAVLRRLTAALRRLAALLSRGRVGS